MNSFSQRYGFKPIKNIIQVDSMDEDLRTSLWNALQTFYLDMAKKAFSNSIQNANAYQLSKNFFKIIWIDYFKKPLTSLSSNYLIILDDIQNYFFKCQWFEVYDFIEFIANQNVLTYINKEFKEYCNEILKRELSGYRFIYNLITPITSEIEIAAIEDALKNSEPYKTVNAHLYRALELLSDRKSPDYRNSIKESISSIEAFLKQITEEKDFTSAINKIENKIGIHQALKIAFIKLYGYASDADGIRHALMDEASLDFEDAKFMLVSCSAFVNYLIVKIEKSKNTGYSK